MLRAVAVMLIWAESVTGLFNQCLVRYVTSCSIYPSSHAPNTLKANTRYFPTHFPHCMTLSTVPILWDRTSRHVHYLYEDLNQFTLFSVTYLKYYCLSWFTQDQGYASAICLRQVDPVPPNNRSTQNSKSLIHCKFSRMFQTSQMFLWVTAICLMKRYSYQLIQTASIFKGNIFTRKKRQNVRKAYLFFTIIGHRRK